MPYRLKSLISMEHFGELYSLLFLYCCHVLQAGYFLDGGHARICVRNRSTGRRGEGKMNLDPIKPEGINVVRATIIFVVVLLWLQIIARLWNGVIR